MNNERVELIAALKERAEWDKSMGREEGPALMLQAADLLAADAQPPRVTPEMLDALRNDIATLRDIQMHSDERAVRLGLAADAQGGEAETFEQWNAKQHGDPEEIGFLQALRVAYCAGQDSVYRAHPQPQAVAQGLTVPDARTYCAMQSAGWTVSRDWEAGWNACRAMLSASLVKRGAQNEERP